MDRRQPHRSARLRPLLRHVFASLVELTEPIDQKVLLVRWLCLRSGGPADFPRAAAPPNPTKPWLDKPRVRVSYGRPARCLLSGELLVVPPRRRRELPADGQLSFESLWADAEEARGERVRGAGDGALAAVVAGPVRDDPGSRGLLFDVGLAGGVAGPGSGGAVGGPGPAGRGVPGEGREVEHGAHASRGAGTAGGDPAGAGESEDRRRRGSEFDGSVRPVAEPDEQIHRIRILVVVGLRFLRLQQDHLPQYQLLGLHARHVQPPDLLQVPLARQVRALQLLRQVQHLVLRLPAQRRKENLGILDRRVPGREPSTPVHHRQPAVVVHPDHCPVDRLVAGPAGRPTATRRTVDPRPVRPGCDVVARTIPPAGDGVLVLADFGATTARPAAVTFFDASAWLGLRAGGGPRGDIGCGVFLEGEHAGVVEMVAWRPGEVRVAVLLAFRAVDQRAGGTQEPTGGGGEPPVVPIDHVVTRLIRAVIGAHPGRPQGGQLLDRITMDVPAGRQLPQLGGIPIGQPPHPWPQAGPQPRGLIGGGVLPRPPRRAWFLLRRCAVDLRPQRLYTVGEGAHQVDELAEVLLDLGDPPIQRRRAGHDRRAARTAAMSARSMAAWLPVNQVGSCTTAAGSR